MKMIIEKEFDNDDYYVVTYDLDNSMQLDSLIDIARKFESDTIKMSICHCFSFDENDCPLYRCYSNIDDFIEMKSLPSPYMDFTLDYCDRDTLDYCFSLVTSINSNVLEYVVNKKRKSVSFDPYRILREGRCP